MSSLTISKFTFMILKFKCLYLPTLQFNGSNKISFIETVVLYCRQLEGGRWVALIGTLVLIGKDH